MLTKGKTMDNLKEQVIEIIKEQLHLKTDFDLNAKFEDLGADSLDVVEIAMTLEDKFDIEITEDDAEHIKSVNDIITVLEKIING